MTFAGEMQVHRMTRRRTVSELSGANTSGNDSLNQPNPVPEYADRSPERIAALKGRQLIAGGVSPRKRWREGISPGGATGIRGDRAFLSPLLGCVYRVRTFRGLCPVFYSYFWAGGVSRVSEAFLGGFRAGSAEM